MAEPTPKRIRPNSILVNSCQKGNPVLNFIKNVPWEMTDTLVPDYEVGKTTGVLFLSLRYHKLHPNYIYERFKLLGKLYKLRLLLVLVDAPDYAKGIRELTRVSVVMDFCLLLSWSNEEAGRYLETFKAFEHKTPDAIKARTGESSLEKLSAVLTNVRSVNKTDVLTLASSFRTVADMINADPAKLRMCPGFGEQKARRFVEAMNTCFDPNSLTERSSNDNK